VYKSPNSDCYIVFGEAKVPHPTNKIPSHRLRRPSQIEDMNSQAQLSAAQQLAGGGGANPSSLGSLENTLGGGADDDDDDDIPELEAPDDADAGGDLDETGLDQKDIDLVMAQVNCSRAKAVKALKDSGGDLINASEYPLHLCMHYRWRLTRFV
jgi:nascent polypeptide-associated complex subunit alpha